MKPGIFDPWRQENPVPAAENYVQTADADSTDSSDPFCARFAGRRYSINVWLKAEEPDSAQKAVGAIIDAIYALSRAAPKALEGSAVSLSDGRPANASSICFRDGSRGINVLSSSTGNLKHAGAVDALAALFRSLSNQSAAFAKILEDRGIHVAVK